MEHLDFGRGHGRNFDHLTMVMFKFWPWSWSKIFDHMTMTPGRRPYGQKIMVALPPLVCVKNKSGTYRHPSKKVRLNVPTVP